jgi:putative copper resistance protein D
MLELLIPMPLHAFFGVAVMMSSALITTTFARPPAGWGVDTLADQSTAGSIAWSFGELPTVLVMLVVLAGWMGSEDRRGRRLDRVAERTADAELAAYNARLRALAEQGRG